MKNLLLSAALLAPLLGCGIHEPTYSIIYTPSKPLTNSAISEISPRPVFQQALVPAAGPRTGINQRHNG